MLSRPSGRVALLTLLSRPSAALLTLLSRPSAALLSPLSRPSAALLSLLRPAPLPPSFPICQAILELRLFLLELGDVSLFLPDPRGRWELLEEAPRIAPAGFLVATS